MVLVSDRPDTLETTLTRLLQWHRCTNTNSARRIGDQLVDNTERQFEERVIRPLVITLTMAPCAMRVAQAPATSEPRSSWCW